MATSTLRSIVPPLITIFLLIAGLTPCDANQPVLGVAPLEYKIPKVGKGITEILINEISASGYYDLLDSDSLAEAIEKSAFKSWPTGDLKRKQRRILGQSMDYLLCGKVTTFTVSDKDSSFDLGNEFNDLHALLGGGSEAAYVVLDLAMIDVHDGIVVDRFTVEGIESKRGERVKAVTFGWAGSVDFESDEFRETQLGRATYKAVGEPLYELYRKLPLTGAVIRVFQDSVVLDWGSGLGIEIGDEITILHARKITNSAGETIWVDETPVGRVEVVEFQPDRCLCLILEGAGMIEEGDLARPITARYSVPLEANEPDPR